MPSGAQATNEERLKYAQEKKLEGNEHFKKSNYQQAIFCYLKALKCLDPSEFQQDSSSQGENPQQAEYQNLQLSMRSNLAAANLNLKQYDQVLVNCRLVLEEDPSNEKCRYRLVKALIATGEYEQALSELDAQQAVTSSSTENPSIFDKLRVELKRAKNEYISKQKKAFGKLFA